MSRGKLSTRIIRPALPLLTLIAVALLTASCSMLTSGEAAPGVEVSGQEQESQPSGPLNLPTVPWEGGADYWNAFEKTSAAGWSDSSFFPIALWFNAVSTNEEVQYDKSLGFNTYIGMDPATPYSLFADNGMYWVGSKLNDTFTDESTNWVGEFLGDEVDGRFDVPKGQQMMQDAADSNRDSGRFGYTNYTQIIMAQWMSDQDTQQYVNGYSDVVSLDMYWYTVPFCSQKPLEHAYLFELTEKNCRTASSYGKTMDALRHRDTADGKLQRLWQFVEIYNGGPGQDADYISAITPEQLKGAVMNSLIHEARGIVYFNQSLSGKCVAGAVVRQSQIIDHYCAAQQVAAAGEINRQIQSLAQVLNTQSYVFDFGPGLDTMLKTSDGSAYIFAMLDDTLQTGERKFTLPEQLRGKPIEVVDENRQITPESDGSFTDHFEAESSYHIYKVQL
ncbi:hypothetical protein [Glutamicibacter sp.]|uniref:hypothetical protein n=1 Tax=Glutamicibacter sp. TaxID=1931995 RepID=UPI002FDFF1CF